MAQGFCSNCGLVLTVENAPASRVEKGRGRCRVCRRKRDDARRDELRVYQAQYDLEHKEHKTALRKKREAANPEKYRARYNKYRSENKERLAAQDKIASRSFKGRHNSLRHALRRDKTPLEDLLWNFNFYSALIQDAVCHYCSGILNETGAGLDRIGNNIGHTCYNVVPCCRRCNRIKAHDFLYDEMMLLAPPLREIVKSKVLTQIDPSVNQSNATKTCVALIKAAYPGKLRPSYATVYKKR